MDAAGALDATRPAPVVARLPVHAWAMVAGLGVLLAGVFLDGIRPMVKQWVGSEEYGYAVLVPFIVLFIVWQKKDRLERMRFDGSWWGVLAVLLGLALFLLGRMSAVDTLLQYALLVVIAGLVLAYTGRHAFRLVWAPLLMLALVVPLPGALQADLSTRLQLVSSWLGVEVMRAAGVSVFLEGNLIDLGSAKLQVVEACNGLRYLFPLMAMGVIAAYFFQASAWKRGAVFLSTLPITVLMNSLRIGLIGVSVEYGGESLATGFLHDLEGWAMFMASLALLFLEIWGLTKLGRDRRPLREVFGFTLPARTPRGASVVYRPLPRPFLVAVACLVLISLGALALPQREPVVPARRAFADFPLRLGAWQGRAERLDRLYTDALNFDDYLMADYRDPAGHALNLYAGYYAAQRADKAPHSPRACMPGQGWEIVSQARVSLAGLGRGGQAMPVNRILIRKDGMRQLVYYWYPQRGRAITDEAWMKWYIFWDSLTRGRSDGALVRLTTPLAADQAPEAADRRLAEFVGMVAPRLGAYVPD